MFEFIAVFVFSSIILWLSVRLGVVGVRGAAVTRDEHPIIYKTGIALLCLVMTICVLGFIITAVKLR